MATLSLVVSIGAVAAIISALTWALKIGKALTPTDIANY